MKLPDAEEQYYLDTFADRVKYEHDFITHRMTWLMTLNGFLFAAYAVMIANSDKISNRTLILSVLGLSLLGTMSNVSSFFSNYWAERSIQEAAFILAEALGATKGPPAESLQTLFYLRLWGRDPRDSWTPSDALRGRGERLLSAFADAAHSALVKAHLRVGRRDPAGPRFFRPPSKLLHSWFLLPAIFALVFAILPHLQEPATTAAGAGGTPAYSVPSAAVWAPTGAVVLVFGVLILLDVLRQNAMRRIGIHVKDGRSGNPVPVVGAEVTLKTVGEDEGCVSRNTGKDGTVFLVGRVGKVHSIVVGSAGYETAEVKDVVCGTFHTVSLIASSSG